MAGLELPGAPLPAACFVLGEQPQGEGLSDGCVRARGQARLFCFKGSGARQPFVTKFNREPEALRVIVFT